MPDQTMTARWHVIAGGQGDMVTLQVELWNGHALTLTAWKDDRAVMLWQGSDGRDFSDDTITSFRRWLATAQGRGART
jgi:hypothetical protein